MILVDIFVPSVDKIYDFQLNETAPIYTVIEEISEMISQKEKSELVGDIGKFQLCDKEKQCVLNKNSSLSECSIITGKRLLLI